jgi:hypothetical protein
MIDVEAVTGGNHDIGTGLRKCESCSFAYTMSSSNNKGSLSFQSY